MGCVVALVIVVVVVVVLEHLDIVALGVHPLSQILPVSWLMLGRLDFVKLGVLPSDRLAGVHRPLVRNGLCWPLGTWLRLWLLCITLDIIICRLDKFSLRIHSFTLNKRKIKSSDVLVFSFFLTQSTIDLGIKYQKTDERRTFCELG